MKSSQKSENEQYTFKKWIRSDQILNQKEDILMVNKRCSTSRVITEIQIKTTWRQPKRKAKIKTTDKTNRW